MYKVRDTLTIILMVTAAAVSALFGFPTLANAAFCPPLFKNIVDVLPSWSILVMIGGIVVSPFILLFFEMRQKLHKSRLHAVLRNLGITFSSVLSGLILFSALALFSLLVAFDRLLTMRDGDVLSFLVGSFLIVSVPLSFFISLAIAIPHFAIPRNFGLSAVWRPAFGYAIVLVPVFSFLALGVGDVFNQVQAVQVVEVAAFEDSAVAQASLAAGAAGCPLDNWQNIAGRASNNLIAGLGILLIFTLGLRSVLEKYATTKQT